jgi:hypothetical protein
MADNSMPLGTLRESTLKELWDSEGIRRLRLRMLRGERSPQCAKCYELEGSGLPSPRQRVNRDFAHHFPAATATSEDGTCGGLRMAYMDVRFSNLCNFRCRTCCPELSSAWQEAGGVRTPTRDPEELWRQLEPLLPGLEEVYFAGGEPLLMEEHYRLLERLVELELFHVRLLYNTNFSVTVSKGRNAMRLWDLFKTVRVGASLDAMGKRGECLRKGQDWDAVVRNRERMSATCPRAEFHIAATWSAMNALHLPDFHAEWVRKGYIRPGDLHLNILLCPEEYRAQVLPERLKRRVAERVEAHLRDLGREAEGVAAQYRAALAFMNAEDRSGELGRFRERTLALDRARGESFAETFPELAELMAA